MSAGNRENRELSDMRPVLGDEKSNCFYDALKLLERAAVKVDPVYSVKEDIRNFLWRMKLKGFK